MSKSTTSKGAKVTDDKQEKLEAAKRREELKTLLMTKFQTKYAGKAIPLSILQSQIDHFLDTMPLTAANLDTLDRRILEAWKPSQKGKAEEEAKRLAAADKDDDNISVMSGATDVMETRTKNRQMLDTKVRHVKGEDGEPLKPKNEEDEWAAIMKFNGKLYKEEMNQEQLKKVRQKMFVKTELEKQMKEKEQLKQRSKEEEQAYLEYQKKHLEELDELEKEKQAERRQQIITEKASRDKQRKEDALRKRIEEREDKKRDQELITRMKLELELEKKADAERKDLEKRTVKKMMEESLKLKEEQKVFQVREREEDVRLQEQQKKLADMQEAERVTNLMRKDERNKKLMEAAIKTTGGKGLKAAEIEEDHKLNSQMQMLYEKQKLADEKKNKHRKVKQMEVKDILEEQVKEKKSRKLVDKRQGEQQADMWKKDLAVHSQQEQINLQKLKEVNKKHQDYLLKQMEMAKKGKVSTMSEQEYMLNKQILDEMKTKGTAEPAGKAAGAK